MLWLLKVFFLMVWNLARVVRKPGDIFLYWNIFQCLWLRSFKMNQTQNWKTNNLNRKLDWKVTKMKVIKILSNLGLVLSSFEQPGPGYLRLWRLNYIPALVQYWFIARDIWRLLLSSNLRVCPREDQAEVTHATSPISLKLSQMIKVIKLFKKPN